MNYLRIVLLLIGFDVLIDFLVMIENRKGDNFSFLIVDFYRFFCNYCM